MQQDSSALRLLTYREWLLTLQHLCKEQRTGTMVINDSAQHAAKVVLEQGVIFDVTFKDVSGDAALPLLKEIKQGTVSFSNRLGQPHYAEPKLKLSTADIFQFLMNHAAFHEAAQSAKADKKITETLPPGNTVAGGMNTLEAQLSVVLGPVAKILYLDYAREMQEATDFKGLNAVIERISKQLLTSEQQSLFRQGMIAFVNQYNLKGQEATLTAIKGNQRKPRLSTASLGLCIAKQAGQGGLSAGLLDNLAFQLERAGNVGSTVALFDVLRLLEKSTKTGLLEVREKEKIGGFYFDKGVLINAVEFGMNGKLIAFDIMQWQHDYLVFRGVAQEGVSRQITQSIEVLIKELEKLQAQDSKPPASPVTPLASKADEIAYLADAIHLIESADNNRAEPLLTAVLMSHEENFKGWFWLSRVLTNMTAIEIALRKAAFLQPKNNELTEEIKKFTQARKVIKGDFVLRCPFCWTPNDEHEFECVYCKSNFFITPDFFKTIGKAKFDLLDKAIERYGNVLQQEHGQAKNPFLRFYLAMAYLNRKYYQEGLDQLHEITRLLPDNNALLMQSRILTDYMNTEGLLRTPHLPPKSENVVEAKVGSQQKKILIVEDSMVTRKVIARTLVANGYEVFEAKNATEALNEFEKKNPHLILLDIILPGKDGYEILAEIRQKPGYEKLPVVMLTSRDSLFDKLKGKVSDANEYLTKPFQPDELLTIVRKYLK